METLGEPILDRRQEIAPARGSTDQAAGQRHRANRIAGQDRELAALGRWQRAAGASGLGGDWLGNRKSYLSLCSDKIYCYRLQSLEPMAGRKPGLLQGIIAQMRQRLQVDGIGLERLRVTAKASRRPGDRKGNYALYLMSITKNCAISRSCSQIRLPIRGRTPPAYPKWGSCTIGRRVYVFIR